MCAGNTRKTLIVTFKSLGLSPALLSNLDAQGYDTPTPIQTKAIPPVIAGRDVIGLAQTGTGKTAAFSLPILHNLTTDGERPKGKNHNSFRPVRCLILSPTRELASQIEVAIKKYSKGLPLRSACVVGGVSIKRQQDRLRQGVDVLVATPGRLEDLMQQKSVKLDRVTTVILDEADQMLDIGFMPAIRRILKATPRERQTLLFSATMPKEIRKLSDDHLTDPIEVSVAAVSATADRIDQKVIHLDAGAKLNKLAQIVKSYPAQRVIVFTRTKRGADRVAKRLNQDNLQAVAIHGNKSQNQRVRALDAFTRGDAFVMVATDIAARGIDVREVELVVNYEMPDVPEAYVHRIGRTGRAGADGQAIALVCPYEIQSLKAIQKLIKQSIPAEDAAGNPVTVMPPYDGTDKPVQGGRGGGGKKGGRGRSGGAKPKSGGGGGRRRKPGGRSNKPASAGSPAGSPKPAGAKKRLTRNRSTKPAPKR